jgi:hypothetical protein
MVKGSIGNQNGQMIYRWNALNEENILEQFISDLVYCISLALKEKEISCEIQLGNSGSN